MPSTCPPDDRSRLIPVLTPGGASQLLLGALPSLKGVDLL